MNTWKLWAAAWIGISFLLNVAVSADGATEAYERGISCLDSKDFDGAILAFTEAIRLKPCYAEAYSDRGLAYLEKDDVDKAIADCNEAIRLDPQLAEAYDNRGDAYEKKGDFVKALADYTKSIRLDPEEAGPRNSLAWILATSSHDCLRNGKRAVENALWACKLSQWKEADYLDTLAAAYAEVGMFNKAVEFQQKALEMATKDADKEDYRKNLSLYKDSKPCREPKRK
ncbi:MAG: tetratricopeptide repeat protein [Planctomycetota bacterium]